MTTVEETVPKPELELQEVDMNSPENNGEPTKELFRREASPRYEEGSLPKSPKSPKSPRSPPSSPKQKTPSKIAMKGSKAKKEEAIKKKSSSGIPLRLKSGTNTTTARNDKKMGSYRHPPPQANLVINRNTLEMQFMNNKKRLLQLHTELVEKQRPLLDMHKSLLRTKKQLEEMGKKVTLEEIKIFTLKPDETKNADSPADNPVTETISTLKTSVDSVLDSCLQVSKKCMLNRDHVVKILEDVAKTVTEANNFGSQLEELKRENEELEKTIEVTFKENEAKINELVVNWQKTVNMKSLSNEMAEKIAELEEKVMEQQKALSEAEDNVICLTRKFEDRRSTLEKTIIEVTDKNNRLEEEMKKEKRTATENLMKTRNLRAKVTDLEIRTREAEEKHNEASKKLSQLQEQMRKKEVQWLKEKDELKKNEELLQQKFSEKQSQLDTSPNIKEDQHRLMEMERLQKSAEAQQQNFYKTVESQLEVKEQELVMLEKEKDSLASKTSYMEEQLEKMKKRLEEKEKEIDELSVKQESLPALEYKPDDNHWVELIEYKQKINELQSNIQEQSEQIGKMQGSLKAHAQLAAALKLEKDNAIKYSNKLREILQEARDEIEYKNKTIYKIHEKLVLKDKVCDKLKADLKGYEHQSSLEQGGDKWHRTKCQICMSNLGGDKTMDYSDAEVGKSIKNGPKYVSDSLIGMSVKKVDHLRARLDNLKKMKLPFTLGKIHPDDPFPNDSDPTGGGHALNQHLRKQIEIRGKLYQILQKHADQSCEDFINLLKISVSKGSRDSQELKPSNTTGKNDTVEVGPAPPKFSNIKITESFTQYIDQNMFNQIYDKLNEPYMCDSDTSF